MPKEANFKMILKKYYDFKCVKFFLLIIGIFIFLKMFYSGKNPNVQVMNIFSPSSSRPSDSVNDFYRIASKYGTDKVTDHSYHNVYGHYLAWRRNDPIDLLEIGLGCIMVYGPGKSLLAWREFLPNAKISILEYDGKCAKKFEDQVEHMFVGDQSDFNVLENVGKVGGPYDIIIDDGGHSNKQQVIHSLSLSLSFALSLALFCF